MLAVGWRVKRPALRFLLLMLVAGPAASIGAKERLSIQVSPAIAFAPANLVVRAMVEQDKDNRSIEIIADSPNYYRSSEIQLDGESAPRTTRFEFRSIPSGDYRVRAVLKGSRGNELAWSDARINVVGTDPRSR